VNLSQHFASPRHKPLIPCFENLKPQEPGYSPVIAEHWCTTEAPGLLDQKKLMKAIDDDLKACREAARFDSTEEIQQRTDLEFSTLTTHLMWAESVGDNQAELEHIVHLLEANLFLRRYQRWRGRSQKG
jgi:hypothetical protein